MDNQPGFFRLSEPEKRLEGGLLKALATKKVLERESIGVAYASVGKSGLYYRIISLQVRVSLAVVLEKKYCLKNKEVFMECIIPNPTTPGEA